MNAPFTMGSQRKLAPFKRVSKRLPGHNLHGGKVSPLSSPLIVLEWGLFFWSFLVFDLE